MLVHRCIEPSLPSAVIIDYSQILPVIMVLIAALFSPFLPFFCEGGSRSVSFLQPDAGSLQSFWIINAFPPASASALHHGAPSTSTQSSLIFLLTLQASTKLLSLIPVVQQLQRASSSFSFSSQPVIQVERFHCHLNQQKFLIMVIWWRQISPQCPCPLLQSFDSLLVSGFHTSLQLGSNYYLGLWYNRTFTLSLFDYFVIFSCVCSRHHYSLEAQTYQVLILLNLQGRLIKQIKRVISSQQLFEVHLKLTQCASSLLPCKRPSIF